MRTQLSPALALSLCRLLNLDRIVDNEVHELIESLFPVSLVRILLLVPFQTILLCAAGHIL